MRTFPSVATAAPRPQAEWDALARLERLATLMDAAFVVPGTGIRMGLAGIVGAVPFAGDVVGGAVSSYIVWEAWRLGAPRRLIARMLLNVAMETGFGAVPVLGDMFDILFRANLKNVALLKRHFERPHWTAARPRHWSG